MSEHKTSSEISLGEIIGTIRRSRWHIFWITSISVAISVVLVLVVPNEYEATAVLSIVSHGDRSGLMGGLSSIASQFGGLAELAGLSPQASSSRSDTIAALQSEVLTEIYLQKNGILPILFPRDWDPLKQQWKNPGSRDNPTPWKGNRLFNKEIRTVTLDNKTGLLTLTIKWKDPVRAAMWANGLIKLTNNYLRDKAIRESDANIAYLKDEASKTDILGVKQAIFALMQKEIGEQMIARGSEEYALKVIDPAFIPERPVSPRPGLWIALGLSLGLMFSIGAAFSRVQI